MSRPINLTSLPLDIYAKTGDPDANWKKELAAAITTAPQLLARLHLDSHTDLIDNQPDFKCLATESYIKKMQAGNIHDPLLRQVLPLTTEYDRNIQHSGIDDPVGDINAIASRGLIQKYHGRALLISTGACAIHCRYCFRRNFPYHQSSCTGSALTDALSYLNSHYEIEEVILSGGDPLVLDNEKLRRLILQLENVKHLQILRIHTRLPIVLPARINHGLLDLLSSTRFQVVMVIHANHANELQQDEHKKLSMLHKAGVTLLNQSVLLKGINDNANDLIALSKQLFHCKTLPYYLHQLDPVRGAMHFQVSRQQAVKLKQQMEQQLPGYLVPKLVEEIAGNKAKTAIFRF